ncbi:MAG: hypothetical protein ACLP7F_06450 [Acidimicrobiales bacterium]
MTVAARPCARCVIPGRDIHAPHLLIEGTGIPSCTGFALNAVAYAPRADPSSRAQAAPGVTTTG